MITVIIYVNKHGQTYICLEFDAFSLKNEAMNAKRAWLIQWSIM